MLDNDICKALENLAFLSNKCNNDDASSNYSENISNIITGIFKPSITSVIETMIGKRKIQRYN